MERYCFRFNFSLLDIHLVSGEHDRNILADTDQIAWGAKVSISFPEVKLIVVLTVPVRDVLIGDTGGNVEHDDTALAVDIVSITETPKFLLSRGIPNIKLNLAQVL